MLSKNNKITKVDDRLKHIAFIMDGNGRWAKKRLLPRQVGHKYGAKAFKDIVKYCFELGIKTVTTYAFSTENWSRPQAEIDSIIQLLRDYNTEIIEDGHARIIYIGDKSNLPNDLATVMIEGEEKTKDRDFLLNIAFNYGGRSEIVNAFNKLIKEGKDSITEEDISNSLYTSGVPDPDLIIRTAGEYRLSNFLLWQCAYSELYFTNVLWPDFGRKQLDAAIKDFYNRDRRYGGLNKNEEKK
ncbi:MAG: di-trans,poly-cis-decaprenylcistransferase [Clostridia bacterium]|nr:di-trans,poly-cis-decaprenylcistransferase [Clostridia bacterium]